MIFQKVITPALSPNVEVRDVVLAIKLFFSPKNYQVGLYSKRVESWFRENFNKRYAVSLRRAREAEYAILKAIGVSVGDEVAIQAFTCAAVVYPILWLGAKPLYIDIEKSNYSMDPVDLVQKISSRTRVIILQHTFGIPGNIEEIKKIAQQRGIYLLEDCAHVIGGTYKGRKLGTYGDAAFFSFGRDKAISSVSGGIAITNDRKIGEKIRKIQNEAEFPSTLWIIRELLHPVLTYFDLFLFRLSPILGKFMLYLIRKFRILSTPVSSDEEKREGIGGIFRYPNALSALLLSQLDRIDRFNGRRQKIYQLYKKHLLGTIYDLVEGNHFFLRIPVLINKKDKLISFCRGKLIYIGNWYSNIVDPKGIDFNALKYRRRSCKTAEKTVSEIVNLPCYPTMNDKDVERVIEVIKQFAVYSK